MISRLHNRSLIGFLLGIVLTGTLAGAPSLTTFAGRRDFIIRQVTANSQAAIKDHPFFVAQACFLAGKQDEGRAIARKGYLSWNFQNR